MSSSLTTAHLAACVTQDKFRTHQVEREIEVHMAKKKVLGVAPLVVQKISSEASV
jgi:hypothetical protein